MFSHTQRLLSACTQDGKRSAQTHRRGAVSVCTQRGVKIYRCQIQTLAHTHLHYLKHTRSFVLIPAWGEASKTGVCDDGCVLSTCSRQLVCTMDRRTGKAIGQHTLFHECVCVRACVTFWLLSHLWPRFLRQRTSGPILPSHLPQRCFCTPALASLTGRVATVMDEHTPGFYVRVLHPCYLPGGALSKTSCWVSCFCRLCLHQEQEKNDGSRSGGVSWEIHF